MLIEELIKSNVSLDISKKIVLNIIVTHALMTERFNELIKPFDLSLEQFNVLRILRGQKGKPINMKDIQERMLSKNSNTTRLIDKLLLKQMVSRTICPKNRRKIEVLISEKGLEVLEKLDPLVLENEKHMTSKLSNLEQTQLNELLEKFRAFNY